MTTQQKADLSLIIVATTWGLSFIAMKIAFVEINQVSLLIFRFSLAFFIAFLIFSRRFKQHFNRQLAKNSILLGVILYLVHICATYGVSFTTASNAGFLVNLTVVLIPIVQFKLYKQPIEPRIWISAGFAIVGIYLLTTTNGLQSNLNLGDVLCMLCAVFSVFHIILTGKHSHQSDPILLSVLQIGVVALLSFIQGSLQNAIIWPKSPIVWFAILGLGVICTSVALIVQTYAQRYTTPAHVGIIFTLEPALTTIFAYFILGEVLTTSAYFGEILIFIGLIITELPLSKIFTSKRGS